MLTRTFQFATNPKPSIVEGGDDFHGRKIERLSSEQIWDSLITLAAGDPDKSPAADSRRPDLCRGDKPVLVGKKIMTQLSQGGAGTELRSKKCARYFNKLVGEIKNGSPGNAASDP